jgi:hypothetical protein
MLNVYDYHDNPKTLTGDSDNYKWLHAISQLKMMEQLTEEEIELLKQRLDMLKYDPEVALECAKHVIKGRFEQAEPAIMEDPHLALAYARDVIKGRWEDAEPIIMKQPYDAYNYAKKCMHGRWKDAEPYIQQNAHWWEEYKKHFNIS